MTTTPPGGPTDLRSVPLFDAFTDAAPATAMPRPTRLMPGRASANRPAEPADVRAVDWALVRALRQKASEELAEVVTANFVTAEQQREVGERIVTDLLREQVEQAANGGGAAPDRLLFNSLRKAVLDALFGLGRLQPLVDNPQIENIEINGFDQVVLQFADGHFEPGAPVADSDEELIDTIAFLAGRQQGNARVFSSAHPTLRLRLDGGARLAASAWVSPRPIVVIRLHRLVDVTLPDLVEKGLCGLDLADFLTRAVAARKSVVVSGQMGAGKTTLLRALINTLDPWESIGVFETEEELNISRQRHPRLKSWEARPGSGERLADGSVAGNVDLHHLLGDGWRYNLDRIVLGEARIPSEVIAVLNAMAGGAGSLSTIHAANARGAAERIATLAMGSASHISAEYARRLVGQHINLIVHVSSQRLAGRPTRRWISEVVGVEHTGDGLAFTDLWHAEPGGIARPAHMPAHLARELGWSA